MEGEGEGEGEGECIEIITFFSHLYFFPFSLENPFTVICEALRASVSQLFICDQK